MDIPGTGTFRKEERLCGKVTVAALVAEGRWGGTRHITYCWTEGKGEVSRILVSVPKKYFKRAVRRNLLKRRMRESYRLQKHLLAGVTADIMLVYNSGEPCEFVTIREEVADILSAVSMKISSSRA